ncbi:MAG: ATP-binding protein [Verrucomicrobiae bacterium]|nr:ATP-binding protein [Verrucomicrobiae bacterium]
MVTPLHFIGREKELQVLENAYGGRAGSLIPIYGRRRVGKTELILRFMRDKPGIYFFGKKGPAAMQVGEFLKIAAEVCGEPLLATCATDNWKTALREVQKHWPHKKRLIIALDEFQWIAGSSPELPSQLQELWDLDWSRNNNVMLLLCGSFIGFMERGILGRKCPLFGRRTATILLQPFTYRESVKFHPRYSRIDQCAAYFICGGIPLYLKQFDPALSVHQNIAQKILDPNQVLYCEPDFLLKEELREVQQYHAILTAVASRRLNQQGVARDTHLDPRTLHYYFRQLQQLGYIRVETPVQSMPVKRTQQLYLLNDSFLRFWFYFVFPNMSQILRNDPAQAFKQLVEPHLDAYYGTCFDLFCREALADLYQKEKVTASFQIGQYWDKNCQIDVVGLRNDHHLDLCECKWKGSVNLTQLLQELKNKQVRYPNPRGASVQYRAFVKHPVKNKHPELTVHALEDLF